MTQTPAPDAFLLRWKGDVLVVTLRLDAPRTGRAVLRTNLGAASIRRREIIAETERGETPLACAWHDIAMAETEPGVWSVSVPLDEVGVFSAKTCFFPEGGADPEWPDGANFHVKVGPAESRRANAIYTVFPRQFGGARFADPENAPGVKDAEKFLDGLGFNVIPPSGTFRDVKRALGHIMDDMRFRIIQLLPIFPTPSVFARMGRYGCPFAALDFLSVDPACAEFDPHATPLDQFRELTGAVHAKGGRVFIDLPANHTGWASTFQTHHPEWFRREKDGAFHSPGAWGVTWADLVELDYTSPELCAAMADVFLFWARRGVDGFRCDAGYMIPAATWTYIVARVREEYPDTVFMLEGLGGELKTTDTLLAESGLNWAYSEIFQTYDRAAFEWYLPGAIARAEKYGALVHFAETHDNDRLAKGGKTWARLRVALAALLSHQGAWGIANGVEWYATEKIDVHGSSALNWGAADNLVGLIGRLNHLLERHPAFEGNVPLRLVTRGDGNTLAVTRGPHLLVVANLDCGASAVARWDAQAFSACAATDLLSGRKMRLSPETGVPLAPGEIFCFERDDARVRLDAPREETPPVPPPDAFVVDWVYPRDVARDVVAPAGSVIRVSAPHPFRVRLEDGDITLAVERSEANVALVRVPDYAGDGTRADARRLIVSVYDRGEVTRRAGRVMIPPPADKARIKLAFSGSEIRTRPGLETVLSNGAGAMSRVKLAWGAVDSQYDALFAANDNPRAPGDRLVLWTRCRAWLRHEGYSRAIDATCVESFRADPAGRAAEWFFRVPCGMGRVARFSFLLSLAEGRNAARLRVTRLDAGERDLGAAAVQIVFRPDCECRSFHETTKAFSGEADIERRIREACRFSVKGGVLHPDGEWTYCVRHGEEAERGQSDCGDVWSPGWIGCDFAPNAAADVICTRTGEKGALKFPGSVSADMFLSVADAAREALKLFIARRDDVKTVIAGFPWFLDWGRDTFIFLRGAIAAGFTREALDIVVAFARFEENGTLPNIIYGDTAGNRDTTDAQLWFVVAVRDLVEKLGKKVLDTDCGGRKLREVLDSIVSHYVSGTPNGIHVDPASGLVWSPSHFTWMDTNYPACTPRIGYPVEIQALWIAALRFLGGKWKTLADRAAGSLAKYFATPRGLGDCLDAPNAEAASEARLDGAIRPNALFAVALGAVEGRLARDTVRAAAQLVVPGGTRSLEADDARYRGRYAGDEDTSRKPAYHNGTVWGWTFPVYAEALVKTGLADALTALSVLASAVETFDEGCVCQISEIADGDAPHAPKGCRAQAWSVSELYRVWDALATEGASS